MFTQANTELVTRVLVQGYVTRGAAGDLVDAPEGMLVDVEAVYEVDDDGKPGKTNLVRSLTANQLEQAEAELVDAWTAAND